MRYRSLDGLRGVAAIIVIFYHALLIVPAVAIVYVSHQSPTWPTASWWLYRTPLRLLLAGHEAVLLFFVLSGFVLTLPLLHRIPGTSRHWLAYYGRRLFRLYIPVWGALILALALALLIHRNPHSDSVWLASHLQPSVGSVVKDGFLVLGTSNLDSPLWSLRWEVWFSLLLPVMFFGIWLVRASRWWFMAIPLLALISVSAGFPEVKAALPGAWLTDGLVQYLPIFGIGMILALRTDALRTAADRLNALNHSRASWWSISIAALLLTVCPTFPLFQNLEGDTSTSMLYLATVIGIVGIIFIVMHSAGARLVFESKAIQWAGSRSFTIYLIHEPILVAAALLLHADAYLPWLLIVAALLPAVLATSEIFYRVIEHPAHLLSRFVGTWLAQRRRRPARPAVPAGVPGVGRPRETRALDEQ